VPVGSLFMAVQGSTRAEKGVHINNSAERCESGRDVAEALDFVPIFCCKTNPKIIACWNAGPKIRAYRKAVPIIVVS